MSTDTYAISNNHILMSSSKSMDDLKKTKTNDYGEKERKMRDMERER